MALPSSGQITLNQIHKEAGGPSRTEATINDADIRGLIGAGSATEMEFTDWYGASAAPTYGGASTGILQGTTNGGVKSYSLTSLGAQQGDLVIVATCQDGPGTLTPYQMSGWTALTPNGTNFTFTQDIYWKVMGSSPETQFRCTLGPYYFAVPVVATCIRGVGGLTASASTGGNMRNNITPVTRTVANAGSVGIVVLCRDDNAAGTTTSSGPSGYTKAGNKYTSNAGIGYNWEQSVDIFYKLNLPTGSHSPGTVYWSQGYDNTTATTAIFY